MLLGDKFVPEMHLRQRVYTYSACRPFTKNKEMKQKYKGAGDSRDIYLSFQHHMDYGDFKTLLRGAASDTVLRDKAFNITKKSKYDAYQRILASLVNKILIKVLLPHVKINLLVLILQVVLLNA